MTTAKPSPFVGPINGALNGIESRILRASLGLERRSVAAWANLRFGTPKPVTAAEVTSWERSRFRGYPQDLVDDLARLALGVEQMADRMYGDAEKFGEGGLALRRPLGGRRILAMLDLGSVGLVLTPAQLAGLDGGEGAREIWAALADTATVRAALLAGKQGYLPVMIQMDREPGEDAGPKGSISPPAKEAPLRLNVPDRGPAPPSVDDLARKAICLTSARVDELETATATFRQALASGYLHGDECRSLMENAPYLMRHIADNVADGNSRGVRTPRLRVMAQDRFLTTAVLTDAILRAAPMIEADYAALLKARPGWMDPKA